MRSLFKSLLQVLLILGASATAAYWSILYIRPYKGVVGNLCDVTAANPHGHCYEMLPSGGFPFTFMWDRGYVSVVGSLSIIEDRFELIPYLMNWAVYSTAFAAGFCTIKFLRQKTT